MANGACGMEEVERETIKIMVLWILASFMIHHCDYANWGCCPLHVNNRQLRSPHPSYEHLLSSCGLIISTLRHEWDHASIFIRSDYRRAARVPFTTIRKRKGCGEG